MNEYLCRNRMAAYIAGCIKLVQTCRICNKVEGVVTLSKQFGKLILALPRTPKSRLVKKTTTHFYRLHNFKTVMVHCHLIHFSNKYIRDGYSLYEESSAFRTPRHDKFITPCANAMQSDSNQRRLLFDTQ